jgi:hypothetical protein
VDIQRIVEGESFDVVEALRALAAQVVALTAQVEALTPKTAAAPKRARRSTRAKK